MATATTVAKTAVTNTTSLNQEPESDSPPEKKLKTDGESCGDEISADDHDYYNFDTESESEPDEEEDDEFYYDMSTDDDDENDGFDKMTPEEYVRYCKQVRQSKGFDVDYVGNVFMFGIIQPVHLDRYPDMYKYFTQFVIDRYNRKKNKNLQFEEIVKINTQGGCPLNYYITFKAKDDEGVIKTYQAIVAEGIPVERTSVVYFRLKPGQ